MSPILYRWTFTSTNTASKELKIPLNEDGLYPFNQYRDIFLYNTLNDIGKFKARFGVDEVILAVDSKPYWREEYWSGYKYGRLSNDKSGVEWDVAKQEQRELLDFLDENSSFKIIKVQGAEGDDVGFVLSEELSNRGHEVIVKSLDHDWIYNLVHDNVRYWETKHTVKDKKSGWVEFDQHEIDRLKYEHCMFGDRGDNLLPVVYYSVFSAEFKALNPNASELKAYPIRHEIDQKFRKAHGVSAYKHPRLGAKSFQKKMNKEGFTVQEFLDRDPIYQMNYDLNARLALPDGIPAHIKDKIITAYDGALCTRDNRAMVKFMTENNLFNLIGEVSLY